MDNLFVNILKIKKLGKVTGFNNEKNHQFVTKNWL